MLKNSQWFNENAVDVDFIRSHEDLTPRGPRHMPISSAEVLTKFREKAKNLGICLVNEKGALKRDGTRFMFTADVMDKAHPDYALTVGFRQASDTTQSFQGICGNSVFICANGVCNSIIKPSRMIHTKGNAANNMIDGRIDIVFERFIEDMGSVHDQISLMKGTTLTDEIVGKFVRAANGKWEGGRFIKNPLLGSTNLMLILKELENPTLNSHEDNSVFRLMNAASFVTTHQIKNPSQGMMASRELNNIIMNIIKSDFKPLGDDVIDIEVAE